MRSKTRNTRWLPVALAVFFSGAILGASTLSAESGALRAGAGKAEITSIFKADLPATGKFSDEHIYVRAIVIDNGVTRAAILGADQAHLFENLWSKASNAIAQELNCPVENIILSATHTHSGGTPNEDANPQFVSGMVSAMVDAVHQAKLHLEPARVGFGTGFSYLNVNRDDIDEATRSWTQGPNLNAPSDKTVSVLKFVRPDGQPIAVYVNYAMHAIDGYLIGYLSGDFPDAMSEYVEDAFPSRPVTIFSQSASGDQNPLYLRPSTNALASKSGVSTTGYEPVRETVEGPIRDGSVKAGPVSSETRDRLERWIQSEGALLGEEVIRVMTQTTKTQDKVRIEGQVKTITCPGRDRTNGDAFSSTTRAGITGTYKDGPPVNIRLGVLGIDNIALTWVDAEIYTRIWQRIKKQSPMANTVLVTIADGRANSGYIPDDESYGHLTFQVLNSRLKPGCAEDGIANSFTDLIDKYARQ
jgi:hypothetical protein